MRALRAWLGTTAAVALVTLPSFGCTRDEAARQGEQAEEYAEEAGEAAGRAADKAGEVAREAGEEVEQAAETLGEKVDAAKQTLDVKAALMAEDGLDASEIDVDTDAATKTLVLRGTVPTAAQKATAERIARDKASGFTVKSELTVATRTSRVN